MRKQGLYKIITYLTISLALSLTSVFIPDTALATFETLTTQQQLIKTRLLKIIPNGSLIAGELHNCLEEGLRLYSMTTNPQRFQFNIDQNNQVRIPRDTEAFNVLSEILSSYSATPLIQATHSNAEPHYYQRQPPAGAMHPQQWQNNPQSVDATRPPLAYVPQNSQHNFIPNLHPNSALPYYQTQQPVREMHLQQWQNNPHSVDETRPPLAYLPQNLQHNFIPNRHPHSALPYYQTQLPVYEPAPVLARTTQPQEVHQITPLRRRHRTTPSQNVKPEVKSKQPNTSALASQLPPAQTVTVTKSRGTDPQTAATIDQDTQTDNAISTTRSTSTSTTDLTTSESFPADFSAQTEPPEGINKGVQVTEKKSVKDQGTSTTSVSLISITVQTTADQESPISDNQDNSAAQNPEILNDPGTTSNNQASNPSSGAETKEPDEPIPINENSRNFQIALGTMMQVCNGIPDNANNAANREFSKLSELTSSLKRPLNKVWKKILNLPRLLSTNKPLKQTSKTTSRAASSPILSIEKIMIAMGVTSVSAIVYGLHSLISEEKHDRAPSQKAIIDNAFIDKTEKPVKHEPLSCSVLKQEPVKAACEQAVKNKEPDVAALILSYGQNQWQYLAAMAVYKIGQKDQLLSDELVDIQTLADYEYGTIGFAITESSADRNPTPLIINNSKYVKNYIYTLAKLLKQYATCENKNLDILSQTLLWCGIPIEKPARNNFNSQCVSWVVEQRASSTPYWYQKGLHANHYHALAGRVPSLASLLPSEKNSQVTWLSFHPVFRIEDQGSIKPGYEPRILTYHPDEQLIQDFPFSISSSEMITKKIPADSELLEFKGDLSFHSSITLNKKQEATLIQNNIYAIKKISDQQPGHYFAYSHGREITSFQKDRRQRVHPKQWRFEYKEFNPLSNAKEYFPDHWNGWLNSWFYKDPDPEDSITQASFKHRLTSFDSIRKHYSSVKQAKYLNMLNALLFNHESHLGVFKFKEKYNVWSATHYTPLSQITDDNIKESLLENAYTSCKSLFVDCNFKNTLHQNYISFHISVCSDNLVDDCQRIWKNGDTKFIWSAFIESFHWPEKSVSIPVVGKGDYFLPILALIERNNNWILSVVSKIRELKRKPPYRLFVKGEYNCTSVTPLDYSTKTLCKTVDGYTFFDNLPIDLYLLIDKNLDSKLSPKLINIAHDRLLAGASHKAQQWIKLNKSMPSVNCHDIKMDNLRALCIENISIDNQLLIKGLDEQLLPDEQIPNLMLVNNLYRLDQKSSSLTSSFSDLPIERLRIHFHLLSQYPSILEKDASGYLTLLHTGLFFDETGAGPVLNDDAYQRAYAWLSLRSESLNKPSMRCYRNTIRKRMKCQNAGSCSLFTNGWAKSGENKHARIDTIFTVGQPPPRVLPLRKSLTIKGLPNGQYTLTQLYYRPWELTLEVKDKSLTIERDSLKNPDDIVLIRTPIDQYDNPYILFYIGNEHYEPTISRCSNKTGYMP